MVVLSELRSSPSGPRIDALQYRRSPRHLDRPPILPVLVSDPYFLDEPTRMGVRVLNDLLDAEHAPTGHARGAADLLDLVRGARARPRGDGVLNFPLSLDAVVIVRKVRASEIWPPNRIHEADVHAVCVRADDDE